MQEKKSVNLGFKNVKAEGFHKVRVQIKKDIERVNWPWNKVMEKYEEKDPRHGSSKKKFGKREQDFPLLQELDFGQKTPEGNINEGESEIEEEFSLLGQGLDNIETLSKVELTNLLNIHKMVSKTVIRILEAYAMLDPEIGYVQGMHSIAVSIVYNFFLSMVEYYRLCEKVSPILNSMDEFLELNDYQKAKKHTWTELDKLELKIHFSEAEMFETLVGTMQNLNLKLCYGNDFNFLKCRIDTFGLLIQEKLYPVYLKLTQPDMHIDEIIERKLKKFENAQAGKPLPEETKIPLISYFASFYLTLFMNLTPVEISHTLISTFCLVGYDVVDHILMGLLVIHQDKILELEDVGEVMKFVTKEMVNISLNCDIGKSFKQLERENYRMGIGSLLLVGSIEQLSDDQQTDNRLATNKFWKSQI